VKFSGRKLRQVGAALAALAAATAVVCLDFVDHRPYFREDYYTETAARERDTRSAGGVVRGELTAGFGLARLTPTINAPQDDPVKGQFRSLPLAGYGSRRGQPATGTHDDLFVKAVALRVGERTVVMVGMDALIVPFEVAEVATRRLAEELKLAREQIYLGATHTHASLGGWGEGWVAQSFAGGFQPGARVWMAECIVAAVRAAVADLQPAALGHGRFAAGEFVRNRLVGELGRVDPEFSFTVVKQKAGRQAVLGSFAAHATVLPSSLMEFSGDYPGVWQREIEQAGGGVGVFLAGSVGSHSAVAGAKGMAGAERMGKALARLLLAELPRVQMADTLVLGVRGLELSLPPLHLRLTDGIRLRPWLARRMLPVRDRTFIQVFRLGDTLWASTPCDYSGELTLGLKDALRARGLDAVVTSFNGDYIGYVIPARYYHLAGYEPRTMSFFGPNLPEYLDECIRTLALGLATRPQ